MSVKQTATYSDRRGFATGADHQFGGTVKNRILAAGAIAALSLGFVVTPASAEGKNPRTSCGLGDAVSFAAEYTRNRGSNFGQANKELGITPGEALQGYRQSFKRNCQGN